MMGMDLSAEVNPKTLAAWAAGPPLPLPAGLPGGLGGARVVSALLGAALTATLLAWLSGKHGVYPLRRRRVAGRRLGDPAARADPVRAVRRRSPRRRVEAGRGAARPPRARVVRDAVARAPAAGAGVRGAGRGGRALPPSRRVARLGLLVDLLDARRNQFAAILTAPLLWTTQVALADRGLAARVRSRGGALAGGGRRDRGARVAVDVRVRAPRAAVPERRRRAQPALFEAEALGAPAAAGAAARRQRRRAGGAHAAAADRQRLEHVREEHAAAHGRRQRGAGAGRRPGLRAAADRLAPGDRRARCGSTIRCRRGARASTRRSRRLRQIVDLADGRRSRRCSWSTSSCAAPTRTTAASAPRGSCVASSSAARSGSSPRTISR